MKTICCLAIGLTAFGALLGLVSGVGIVAGAVVGFFSTVPVVLGISWMKQAPR